MYKNIVKLAGCISFVLFVFLGMVCVMAHWGVQSASAADAETKSLLRIVLDEKGTQKESRSEELFYAAQGQTVLVTVQPENETVPAGSFRVVNVTIRRDDSGDTADYIKPKVRTGYPESQIVFADKGNYSVRVQVNDMCKTSCAGVSIAPVMERQISITVR